MAIDRAVKSIALYTEREVELWREAERVERAERDGEPREGEVLAGICSGYLDGEGDR